MLDVQVTQRILTMSSGGHREHPDKAHSGMVGNYTEEPSQEINGSKKQLKEVRVEAVRAGFKQCYQDKDFKTLVEVGDRIPDKTLMEDGVLLPLYDVASTQG